MTTDNHKGFTLFELLIVLVIIGLIGGLAAPHFKSNDKVAFRVKADMILSALQYARKKAIITGTPQKASLVLTKEPVKTAKKTHDDKAEINWITKGEDLFSFTHHSSLNNNQTELAGQEQEQTIVFYPDGSSNGGEFTLSANKHEVIFKIDSNSGSIKMEQDNK